MFKLKFKQKMKPNFLLCLTLRRKTLEIHVRISRVTTFWFYFLTVLNDVNHVSNQVNHNFNRSNEEGNWPISNKAQVKSGPYTD